MFWKTKRLIYKRFDALQAEHEKMTSWADKQFKRMEVEMDAIFGSTAPSEKMDTKTSDQSVAQKLAEAEETIAKQAATIDKMERTIRDLGVYAYGKVSPCDIRYDRDSGELIFGITFSKNPPLLRYRSYRPPSSRLDVALGLHDSFK